MKKKKVWLVWIAIFAILLSGCGADAPKINIPFLDDLFGNDESVPDDANLEPTPEVDLQIGTSGTIDDGTGKVPAVLEEEVPVVVSQEDLAAAMTLADEQAVRIQDLEASLAELLVLVLGPEIEFDLRPVADSGASWAINGAPEEVDPIVVDVASGGFTNEIGLGSQQTLADKGAILYGAGEDREIVEAGRPHSDYVNPLNQSKLGNWTWWDGVPEGGFVFVSGNSFTVKVDRFEARMEDTGNCDHNSHLYIRGWYRDGLQDSDRNSSIQLFDYSPGSVSVTNLPIGGFVSEGAFLQAVGLSHSNAGNCGAEGASGLTVMFLDLNTGAYTVLYQSNLNQPWEFVDSNWFSPTS